MKQLTLAILIAASLSAGTAFAHDRWGADHSCSQPIKPFEFTSQWQVDQFNMEVDNYRMCIQNFVDEQNDAIDNHSSAAEEAISEWNNFVDFELN
ncbi:MULTISPECIES: hypothetical protein [Halomonas]|uniref:hypothetical protein n=1 Tax=Halomonas TaxID=2745 RepID=UPI000368AAC9|nr:MULTISPECIES: hypothetical protein [Halomonas]KJZ17158.1 hypothetical protein TW86_04770 [Halomonas sp. S2151]MCO7215016.1 hypothetical protein [Halomonas sp. OfavH-34-E]RQW70076.1 hypothetical protein EBB56_15615 [Halomonas sp. YLB-10]